MKSVQTWNSPESTRIIVSLNDTEMREGDGAAIENERTVTVEADTDAEILLFDLG